MLVPDVGGGFGQKIPMHPEEVAVALAARATRPPGHLGRGPPGEPRRGPAGQGAARSSPSSRSPPTGRSSAFGRRIVGNAGAYSYNNASALIEPYLSAVLMPGVYRLENLEYEVIAVVTNKPPVAPYRGVGWTSGHCARELLIEAAAHELGLDPAELRRRNLVEAGEFPYTSCTGMIYDSGSFVESLDRALEHVDYHGVPRAPGRGARTAATSASASAPTSSRPAGAPRGAPGELGARLARRRARHRSSPRARSPSASGRRRQGQGHATVFAQLVADRLGVGLDDVRVRRRRHGRPSPISHLRHAREPHRRGRRRCGHPGRRSCCADASLAVAGRPARARSRAMLEIVDGGVGHRVADDCVLTLAPGRRGGRTSAPTSAPRWPSRSLPVTALQRPAGDLLERLHRRASSRSTPETGTVRRRAASSRSRIAARC